MNFIEELRWRDMLHDMTPGTEEMLTSGQTVGYIGFDPTAPSMGIGNFVQIQLLKLFQLCGHTPIVLMGGATGRIGDPSGKDKERELKSYDELDSNLEFQKKQIHKFLDFDGSNKAIVVNNHNFYKEMNVLDFLRDVGKTLTVNYMMSKDSVKNRLDTGLSFTEFSYQLLQAYDFQVLYNTYQCRLQMGGSDQWGNITSGTEFIRRNVQDGKAYAVTTPLLTKADGKKFGKSEQGNVWLSPSLTSAYKFYQFWINCDDADVEKFIKYFTLKSKEDALAMLEQYKDDPRMLKRLLAEELTTRVHSLEDVLAVQAVTEKLFGSGASRDQLLSISASTYEDIAEEIPSFQLGSDVDVSTIGIIDFLTYHAAIFASKSEARRAIQNNAVSVNKTKVISIDLKMNHEDWIHDRFMLIENGKKNKYLICK